ncbi:hypothetical protein BESB_048580 [Besnoitia besnoiti]|uniref:Rhodanese domain-containing protein n=1 Tax=Besnoitia besnoiti TaxID=94643 RepID=A0A2A9MKY2_BESBE|nr:hypothetical protein BESB_048580 [Besnoitia besnoiti]PFH36666.1 hypothetical protein BESB_048580 [Besnoitia besnoiti]
MAAPSAVDFHAMLAEARREAALRRQQHQGASTDPAASVESSPSAKPLHKTPPPPACFFPGLRRLAPADFFNLLQTPASASSQEAPTNVAGEPQQQNAASLAQRTVQAAIPNPVVVVDLRKEELYRARHVRRAVQADAFLEDVRKAVAQDSAELSSEALKTSLPENIVFYACSHEENERFSLAASHAEGEPALASATTTETEADTQRSGEAALSARLAEERQRLRLVVRDLESLVEQRQAAYRRSLPPEAQGMQGGLGRQRVQKGPLAPRLFWLEGGFAAFWHSFPFLCLSTGEEEAAATRMDATAAAALMSYPREIFRLPDLPSVDQSRAHAPELPADSPAVAVTPFRGVFLGSMLHAMSRGVRRRLRIHTILDLSKEGLPPTLGNCNCVVACPASGGCVAAVPRGRRDEPLARLTGEAREPARPLRVAEGGEAALAEEDARWDDEREGSGDDGPDTEGGEKHARTPGSVLVVHSSDLCSISATSAVLAAFLATEPPTSGSSWVSAAQRARHATATGFDGAALALARLMRRWPTTRLEAQHYEQLERFCARVGRLGTEAGRKQGHAGSAAGSTKSCESAAPPQHSPSTRLRGRRDPADACHSSVCEEGKGDEGDGVEAESSADLHAVAMRLTLDLCRLPSQPVFLLPLSLGVSAAAAAQETESSASDSREVSVATLLWGLTYIFDAQGTIQSPTRSTEAVGTREQASLFTAVDGHRSSNDELHRLLCGLASLLARVAAGSAPSSQPSSRAEASSCPAQGAFTAGARLALHHDVRSFSATEHTVRAGLLDLATWRGRGGEDLAPSAETGGNLSKLEAWTLLANCVGCWAAGVQRRPREEEFQREAESSEARQSSACGPSRACRLAVLQGLCQVLEATATGMRCSPEEMRQCSPAVEAFLLNMTILKEALEGPAGSTMTEEEATRGAEQRPSERAAPENESKRNSKNEEDARKRLKKLLVSLLVQAAGREAAAFLILESENRREDELRAGGTNRHSTGMARETSPLQASHRGAASGSLPAIEDTAGRQETFLGRSTLALRFSLTALYGAFVRPLFLDTMKDSATCSKGQLQADRASQKRGDKSMKRLKDLFNTESLRFVLQVADIWSAKHPSEGCEALKMLQQIQAHDTRDKQQGAEEGLPASLGLVLRPVVLVAGEM